MATVLHHQPKNCINTFVFSHSERVVPALVLNCLRIVANFLCNKKQPMTTDDRHRDHARFECENTNSFNYAKNKSEKQFDKTFTYFLFFLYLLTISHGFKWGKKFKKNVK